MSKNSTNYFTYIVQCSDGSFYTGLTNDLEKRVNQHNGVKAGGAKYTRSRRPVKLCYYEAFAQYLEAMKRENEIKKFSRKQKIAICKSIAMNSYDLNL